MGIFSRFRDIVSSNINSMLDKAEDPEKLVKLIIREMEDTLVEIKASCAGAMAEGRSIQRQAEEFRSRVSYWKDKASLAINKGRDDLAREALMEKRKYANQAEAFGRELDEHRALIEEYQADIRQLEEKLVTAREKQRILVQRHIHANGKRRAQDEIRRIDSSETLFKFDELENRIERMEAEADLVNLGTRATLKEDLDRLAGDEEIEQELRNLKASISMKA